VVVEFWKTLQKEKYFVSLYVKEGAVKEKIRPQR
jgi:hypothetical protein